MSGSSGIHACTDLSVDQINGCRSHQPVSIRTRWPRSAKEIEVSGRSHGKSKHVSTVRGLEE
jgi:hypothetical protein